MKRWTAFIQLYFAFASSLFFAGLIGVESVRLWNVVPGGIVPIVFGLIYGNVVPLPENDIPYISDFILNSWRQLQKRIRI